MTSILRQLATHSKVSATKDLTMPPRSRKPSRTDAVSITANVRSVNEIWREKILRGTLLEGMPGYLAFKTKSSFGRADILTVVNFFSKKQRETEKLVEYERAKSEQLLTLKE